MSLDSDEPEQEQNEIKDLQMQLSETTSLVKTLSQQLGELRDKVKYSSTINCLLPLSLPHKLCNLYFSSPQINEQRKLMQRKTLHTNLPQTGRFATLPRLPNVSLKYLTILANFCNSQQISCNEKTPYFSFCQKSH